MASIFLYTPCAKKLENNFTGILMCNLMDIECVSTYMHSYTYTYTYAVLYNAFFESIAMSNGKVFHFGQQPN